MSRFEELKARVAALGCQLLCTEAAGLPDDVPAGKREFCMHIFDPQSPLGTNDNDYGLVVVNGDDHEIECWCERREAIAAGVRAPTKSATDTDSDSAGQPSAVQIDNPIRAFLLATQVINCQCGHAAFHRGLTLVSMMSAQIKDEDDSPTLPLTVADCADVLDFMTHREGRLGEVEWGGRIDRSELTAKYNGDPGYGCWLLVEYVREQLRAQGGAQRGAS